MTNMKSYHIPAVKKILMLPKKDPSLQSLITQARDELDKIIKDPMYSTAKFEDAHQFIKVWFEDYIQRCQNVLKDVEVRKEFTDFAQFM